MEKTIGKRISANRKRLGLTQDQLAEKLGVTAQAVSKWENNQSCPDISTLPALADILGISIDSLLGRTNNEQSHEGEVINSHTPNTGSDLNVKNGLWEFTMDPGRKSSIALAVFIITFGLLYLIVKACAISLSFWDLLWPTALLIWGVFGLFPNFSFIRLGCAIAGIYILLCKLSLMSTFIDANILFAIIILLLGLHLLVKALKKPQKSQLDVTYTDTNNKTHHGKFVNDFQQHNGEFTYSGCFGSNTQYVTMDMLKNGSISTSFGEYQIDLTHVLNIDTPCHIDADCAFGELEILVPRKFQVVPASSTTFASVSIEGQTDCNTEGEILVDASVSFGEIIIKYI